jgi:hypothetical protein
MGIYFEIDYILYQVISQSWVFVFVSMGVYSLGFSSINRDNHLIKTNYQTMNISIKYEGGQFG